MVVITSNQREVIFEAVQAMYTEVASFPEKVFHFPTGREACEFVGYPGDQLDHLPVSAVESFAGVGYPFAAKVLAAGDVVLDVGAGSGTDVLVGRRLVGSAGAVIGLDMTPRMREKLRANLVAAGASDVRVLDANAERIPLPDASVDVVTSNGVLNLVPDKPAAVREIFRVMRAGGRLQIADIVLGTPPSPASRARPQLWAECIVGATTEGEYIDCFRSAGFRDVEVLSSLDYFARSPSAETRRVAASLGALSIVMRGRKP